MSLVDPSLDHTDSWLLHSGCPWVPVGLPPHIHKLLIWDLAFPANVSLIAAAKTDNNPVPLAAGITGEAILDSITVGLTDGRGADGIAFHPLVPSVGVERLDVGFQTIHGGVHGDSLRNGFSLS